MLRRWPVCAVFVLIFISFSSCSTYYQKNRKFNRLFEEGKLERAENLLASDEKAARKNSRLLHFMNLGMVQHLRGEYPASNESLEKAILIADDIRKNYLAEAASFITNPKILPYPGEDFELLYLNYIKALNYLKLNDFDAALVETRRMNNRLTTLGDKYKSEKRFKRDAFIHNLMGIIYEANNDHNNAFIAYRNSYNIYQEDYKSMFGTGAPEQLKQDLVRAAYRTGFTEDAQRYEREFGIKYKPVPANSGELIFLWHDGLAPVKDEWGITFALVRGEGGMLFFRNQAYNLSFGYDMSDRKTEDKGLEKVEFVRVAFPRYLERPLVYTSAKLEYNGQDKPLELAENVNAVAQKTLQDRMLLEMGKGLLRLALKKAAEYSIREQNEEAGAVVGAINAISEQADTRNWQTLPHSIFYTRLYLPAGEQKVKLITQAPDRPAASSEFTYDVRSDRTIFQTYMTIDAHGPRPMPLQFD
ncbi:MAG: hypothetical protein WD077_16015 [Bacteroidia bacterium]